MRSSGTVVIAAAPEAVFPWLTEPQKLTQWLGGLVESRPLGDGVLRVGARSIEVVEENGRRIEMETVVTRLEPARTLAARIEASPFACDVEYELAPVAGGTEVRYSSEVRMKGAMRILTPLLAGAIRRKTGTDLASLKRAVEGGGG